MQSNDEHVKEIQELRTEVERLKTCLKKEREKWRLVQIGSPLTGVRFGAACGPDGVRDWDADADAYSGSTSEGTSVSWSTERELPLPSAPKSSQRRESYAWRWWPTWCPCCRRPIDITSFKSESDWHRFQCSQPRSDQDKPGGNCAAVEEGSEFRAAPYPAASTDTQPLGEDSAVRTERTTADAARYAYVAGLWGYSTGFVLGALTLGAGLRASGTKHDLVLLHTDDVPSSSLQLLKQVWILREVPCLIADERLFNSLGSRFEGVFTKLHVLNLTEYTKVIMLDLDVAIIGCLDDLFALRAPAALHRRATGARHGSLIEGRNFFAREALDAESHCFQWGQASGINAGVMLLAPDAVLYERVLKEIEMPQHPSHISSNGPEQDYLSRLLAPWWTHIGAQYNLKVSPTTDPNFEVQGAFPWPGTSPNSFGSQNEVEFGRSDLLEA